MYRVIHKSLRDFRPLRYSNQDGNAEGEHVNRGRDTPNFCPTLQVLDMSTLGDAADVKFGNSGKFQDTERFFIPCPRHVSSRLPPSDKTWKYATGPITKKKKTWKDSPLIYTLLSAVSVLVVAQRSSKVPEGLMNNPVYWNILTMHGPINVNSSNNTSKWQMGFNSAFKGLNTHPVRLL
jgi:hypothetical protein